MFLYNFNKALLSKFHKIVSYNLYNKFMFIYNKEFNKIILNLL